MHVGDAPPIRFSTRDMGKPHGFEIETEPGTADVDVVITARRPSWRHFCFNMQVVE